MITSDILVTWPIHLDFPLFRYNMVKYKDYFRSLTIVLSNHHMERDYSNFIRKELPFAQFVEGQGDDPDWRNGAVNRGLDVMPKDGYVLFMEQDFFWKDEKFLETVFSISETYDVPPIDGVFFSEGRRHHPAFSLIKRELVDKTSRDFSAYPDTDNKDHFGRFFDEILLKIPSKEGSKSFWGLDSLKLVNKVDYYHLNGLSQNYHNFKLNQPFHNPDVFLEYNYLCQQLPIETHPQFLQIEKQITAKFGEADSSGFLSSFFPGGD